MHYKIYNNVHQLTQLKNMDAF